MELLLERIANCRKTIGGVKREYCVGHLYVDGKYLHDVIEDIDRGLELDKPETWSKKVASKTAIPTGRYRVRIDRVSPKFSQKAYYKKVCNGKLPYLDFSKPFAGVLMHCGKDERSSAGCLIQGYNKVVGAVTNSTQCFENLLKVLKSAKGEIYITITRKYKV